MTLRQPSRCRAAMRYAFGVLVLTAGTLAGSPAPRAVADASALAGSWSAPVALAGGAGQQLSADGSTAIWWGGNALGNVIRSSRWSAGGWTPPVDVSIADGTVAEPHSAFGPQLSADGSTAVWYRFDGTEHLVQSSRFVAGSWAAPVDVSAHGGDASEPQLSGDGSTAVWSVALGADHVVQASRRSGGGWSPPVSLSAPGAWSPVPQVSGNGGTVVWRQSTPTGWIVQSARWTGGGWSAPVALSLGGTPGEARSAYEPQISDDGSTAVWYRYDGAMMVVQSSRFASGSWTAPVNLSDPAGTAGGPQVSGDGRVAVWSWYGPGPYVIQVRRFGAGGWSAPVTVSSGGTSTEPQVSTDGTTVVWRRLGSVAGTIQASRDDIGSWTTPVDLSVLDGSARAPQVSAHGTTALWNRVSGPGNWTHDVESARYTPAAPTASAVSPASGPVTGGTRVTITGTGFIKGASVSVGGAPATGVVVESTTTITATTPAHHGGSVTVTVAIPGTAATAAVPYRFVDNVRPTAWLVRPVQAVSLSTSIAVAWAGRDVGGTVASYQVQRAQKSPGGVLGSYTAWGGPRRGVSAVMTGARPGSASCWRVRATDTAGNVSAWSTPRCVALPVDDRALLRSPGWTRTVMGTAYQRTLTTSLSRGTRLTLPQARGSALVLVVTMRPGGGSLAVRVGGRAVALVRTAAGRTLARALVRIPVRTAGAPVVLQVQSPGARGVAIDGLAIVP